MKLGKKKRREHDINIDITPWLKKCLDEYFAPGQFIFDRSHIVDMKWRSDACYVVILFNVDGHHYIADIAGVSRSYSHEGAAHYEVCNDGEDITLEQWKGLRVDPYCDSFTLVEDRG